MKRSYWRPGIRKPADDRINFRERLDPNEPVLRPVAIDLRRRLALRRCHVRWRADVAQKRAKDFGFFSFAKARREARAWRVRNAERAARAVAARNEG